MGFAGSVSTRPAPPLPPDGTQASAITSFSFKLSWAPPSGQGAAVTGYSVSVEPAGVAGIPATMASADAFDGHLLTNGRANGVHHLDNGSNPSDAPAANGILPNKRQRRLIPVKGNHPETTISGQYSYSK